MAIYKENIVDIDLEKGQIHRAFLNHSIGMYDQKADRFGIRVFRDGEPVDLTGVAVQGVFMPPQGSPIAITGSTYTSIDGNTAEVILPQACYNYEGTFTLAIKLVDSTNSVTGTMRIVDGMADNTHASGTVAPTGAVPTYQEVLAVYDELLQDVTDYESVVANQDAKIDDLKSALNVVPDSINAITGNYFGIWVSGYYKTPDVGSAVSLTNSANWVTTLIPVVAGDKIYIDTYGGTSNSRQYVYIDSEWKATGSRCASGTTGARMLTAPANAVYVAVNNQIVNKPSGFYAFKGESIKTKTEQLRDDLSYSNDVIGNNSEADIGNRWLVFRIGAYEAASTPLEGKSVSFKENTNYVCAISPCTKNEKFNLHIHGSSAVRRAYFFCDSDMKVIEYADTDAEVNGTLIVPNNDNIRFVAFNNLLSQLQSGFYAFKGESTCGRIEALSNDVFTNIANVGVVSTGIPAMISGAVAGAASCTTNAEMILRYAKNMISTSGEPSSSAISRDENGAYVLNVTPTASNYIDIQTGITLKGGVKYRVDGSPKTNDNAGLCLYTEGGDRKAYDVDKTGATYTPETDETVRLRLRVIEGSVYENVKFYPVLCENETAARFAPNELTLVSGDNEVIGFDFNPLTVTYSQSKILLLENEVDEIKQEEEKEVDVLKIIKQFQNEFGTYTSSFTFDLSLKREPIILTISAKYTGSGAPTIRIGDINPANDYSVLTSPEYVIGGTIEPTRKSWRIPMMSAVYTKARIVVTIPQGTTLTIQDAYLRDDQRNRFNNAGIRFHGHRGSIAPADTVEAFQLAAELGYNTMITIPKFTTDGIGICYHDDGNISNLRMMDGSTIPDASTTPISSLSYDFLTQNYRKASVYWGMLHVPTLDDYFRVCSLTGMTPIMSLHSSNFGATWSAGFTEIKRLAKKWGVLNGIGIKAGSDTIFSAAKTVFDKSARYIWINGQSHDPYNVWNFFKTLGFIDQDAIDLTGCEYDLCSEYFYAQTVPGAAHYETTMAQIEDLLSKGMPISIATTGNNGISGAEMNRLIGIGVTEFTVDLHISMGLDW